MKSSLLANPEHAGVNQTREAVVSLIFSLLLSLFIGLGALFQPLDLSWDSAGQQYYEEGLSCIAV
jgi:hypothetical protein